MSDFHTDLVGFLNSLTNPAKGAKADVGQYSFTYASLDTITRDLRYRAEKHNLAIIQDVLTADGQVHVTTVLIHASGESLHFGPLSGPMGNSFQQMGSAITYLRRYSLMAALNIVGDDDTDHLGTPEIPAGVVTTMSGSGGRIQARNLTQPATEKQLQLLGSLARKVGYDDTAAFLASDTARKILGGAPSDPLNKGHASEFIDAITEHLGQKEPSDG